MIQKKDILVYIVCCIMVLFTLFNVYEDIERLLGSTRRVTTRRGKKEYVEDITEE